MASRKRSKTSGEGSSSEAGPYSGLFQKKQEQRSTVEENDGRLYNQDWVWEKIKESSVGDTWKWKMVNAKTSIPERVVLERMVNVEEFRTIGIIQMFERLGWERVLDWCEDITPRIYLTAVCEWLASLRFNNKDGPPHTW
ncbi:hypothetical protein HanRHA438_Chr01g0016651 [Helianthus annuus]|uniref:Uncharacterized protein n=1 Tax=Helianthus annuus TaxID=4232 RepID=A0A9K3JUX0_HELAN|nr:hypothetical protein HanXRQr2_Chr01g0016281 [Helianthus annuus]KAJ0622266.1 hypothetical protein HanIR_Chr01g0018041 [Helianthus annuus]KAJ0626553.1 hypothetical protein HanHA89_Chr01g0014471 [Helianthus annuus]KAJ0947570.1 hypothetical protein HanRHA438_Chr01g0016651 [Helianthus annuus]KAJ0956508.1 hypothetical protein HanPSC8_Chr01g0015601 [Helianthus annuus]